MVDLLELGDVTGADAQIAAASQLAEALHRPLYLWWTSVFRCTRAQLDGDFERAEQLAQEALAIGQRGEAENATHVFAQSMFNIRREQGRLAEVEEAVRGFVSLYPAVPAWRCALGLLLVEVGREAEARVQVETLGDRGFGALPRDANWLIAVTLLAEVCARLGDVRARAGALRAAPALRRAQRRRRARDGLQRLGLPPARHARRDASATSPRRSATSATPWP